MSGSFPLPFFIFLQVNFLQVKNFFWSWCDSDLISLSLSFSLHPYLLYSHSGVKRKTCRKRSKTTFSLFEMSCDELFLSDPLPTEYYLWLCSFSKGNCIRNRHRKRLGFRYVIIIRKAFSQSGKRGEHTMNATSCRNTFELVKSGFLEERKLF